MAVLRKVEIKGFRSIKETSIELGSLNVLIGANGAGKSNFVAFFKLLNEMMAGRLQEYVGRVGRAQSILHFGPKVTPQIEGLLEFEVSDGTVDTFYLRLFHAANDTLIFADETLDYKKAGWQGPSRPPMSLGAGHTETKIGVLSAEGNSTAKVFRHILNRCRVYHFHDTSATAQIRQTNYINDNRWLMADAGNLAAMLYAFRLKNEVVYQRIVSTIRKVMPDFDDFDLEPSRLNPNEISLNWRRCGHDYLFGPHQISDGTLRVMALVTLLLQPTEDLPGVVILDEPELGLHPYALEIVAGLIRAASVKSQTIVATQSQTFLNFFEPNEVITVDTARGESIFRRLGQDEFREWLDDYTLGELWQRNVLGGGPLP
jgi:predicted ATPase